MNILKTELKEDFEELYLLVKDSFADGEDGVLEEWLSFDYMKFMIEEKRGLCVKIVTDEGESIGMVYGQQENPVNGREGVSKWVVVVMCIHPECTGGGVGGRLLAAFEKELKFLKVEKIFTYTNHDDEQVINFYRKNGYRDAGVVKNYQYGKDNSAAFLVKYLDV